MPQVIFPFNSGTLLIPLLGLGVERPASERVGEDLHAVHPKQLQDASHGNERCHILFYEID